MFRFPASRKLSTRLTILLIIGIVVAAATVGGSLWINSLSKPTNDTSTLRLALFSFGAEVLDPSLDSQDGLKYHGYMFDHLLGVTPNGALDGQTGIVERWSGGSNAAEYVLTLREGSGWHTDDEITSTDIALSLKYYSRDAATCGGCAYLSRNFKEVQEVDRYTAIVTLNEPDIDFLSKLAPIQGDTPLVAAEDLVGDDLTGSGPWKFVARLAGERIDYESNKDYWDADRVPAFDNLTISLVPENETRLAMLETNVIDMTPIGIEDVEPLKNDEFNVDGPKNIVSTTMRFMMSYDPNFLTSKPEFREALILGADLQSIVESIYPTEAATLAYGSALFNPLSEGFDPNLPPYPYNPQRARELLNQSGYQNERVQLFSITAYGLTQMPKVNDMIAADWREVGLNVELIPTDWPQVQSRLLTKPQQFSDAATVPLFHGAAPNRLGGTLDSISRYVANHEGSLLTYHDLEKGNRVLHEISAMVDPNQRRELLLRLNRESYGEFWAIPIIWRHEVYGLNPALEGWQPTNGTGSDLRLETLRRPER